MHVLCVSQCLAEGLTSRSTEATSSMLSVARRLRRLDPRPKSEALGDARQHSQLEVCPAGGLSDNKSVWRARPIFVLVQVHAERCHHLVKRVSGFAPASRTYATIRGLEFRVQATIARSTSDARILPFS